MAWGGRENMIASQSAASRLWYRCIGVFTVCVKTECEAASGRKMHSTDFLVRWEGRPSGEGWRSVPPTLPKKGGLRGEAPTLFLAPMCQDGTFSRLTSYYDHGAFYSRPCMVLACLRIRSVDILGGFIPMLLAVNGQIGIGVDGRGRGQCSPVPSLYS